MTASRALGALTHLAGAAAFLYPFFLSPAARADERAAHGEVAPFLFAGLAALLVALAVADVRAGRSDAKRLALLGVLAGVNAFLRLPGALGGGSLMFALPVLCGAAFGARFGFLLGASSFAASAVITGGVGPWMPFQMFALGWVGAGGGAVARLARGRALVPALVAYGWAAGYAFGALTNLWFWPFQQGAAAVAWTPGLGLAETLRRYWRFYVLTSLAWDSSRAILNAVLIGVLGAPVLRLLSRFRERVEVRWEPREAPAPEQALA